MVFLHHLVKRRKVDRPFQLLGQRGKDSGFIVDALLLNDRAAEWAELARDGQLPAAVLAKHGWFLLYHNANITIR